VNRAFIGAMVLAGCIGAVACSGLPTRAKVEADEYKF
jgi:hypothetical protein